LTITVFYIGDTLDIFDEAGRTDNNKYHKFKRKVEAVGFCYLFNSIFGSFFTDTQFGSEYFFSRKQSRCSIHDSHS